MIASAAILLLSAALAQVPVPPPPPPPAPGAAGQPRDVVRRPEPTGSAVIRGRVVAADTGNPMRRANVSLQPVAPPQPLTPPPGGAPPGTVTTAVRLEVVQSGAPMGMARARTATTDAQGVFEFSGLPAGTYRVMASPGQYSPGYLSMAYGAKRPAGQGAFEPGATIEVADGQRFDKAAIALPRGGVISGRITDENGDPMARVQVYTLFFPPGSSRGSRMGAGAQTDDLGHFRLYGLNPGDYAVVAEARGPTFVPPNAPPETEDDKIGFMTTYYPGTPDEGTAQRVRARAGAETPGVEIRMMTGRLFRLSGIVSDSQGRPVARSNGQFIRRTANSTSSFGFTTDEQGRFAVRNIPPGTYRLVARNRQGPPGEGMQGDPGEMGSMPITVNSDLEGLFLMLSPGATVTGQVVFEQGPPQLPPGQQSFQMRVNGTPADPEAGMGIGPSPSATVTPDLTFTLRGLHGELLLRTGGPNMFLKSVTVGGRDVTDTGYEFKNGDQVILTMTTRTSTLEGMVTDAGGKPVTDAAILVFSDDKTAWRVNATRTRRGTADPTGKYRVAGLLPGRYYVIAAPRERLIVPSMGYDTSLFEQLVKEATPFVIGEDEQRQVDLKVLAAGGGL
ncbi:MAG TPA: carboxypeptidase-like regulatory domain-containing protein [Vicinamibacterales bacterium]|nr:carboxypeptidase-like regulatory domain-containing protein [Vicinamibacterales bacterium]